MRIGLLSSIGATLDAFFPELVSLWREEGAKVFPAAGTEAVSFDEFEVLGGITRAPRPVNWRAPREVAAWAERHSLDVVLTNTATASALARVPRMPCPVVYFCHGLHWSDSKGLGLSDRPWQLVEKLLVRRTAGVMVLNSDDERWFRSQHHRLPVHRLAAGVGLDLEKFPRSAMPTQRDPVRLVWVGELGARKRPQLAVELATQLGELHVPFELTMLGEGPLRKPLEDELRRRNLNGSVRLPGRVAVRPYLERANAVVHTASWEGLPRALLEAVAVGRTPIAFDVKGVRDIPGALLVPDGDVAGMAQVVADMMRGQLDWAPPDAVSLSVEECALEISSFLRDVVRP